MKLRKFIKLFIVFLTIFVCSLSHINVIAASSVEKVNASTILDSQYSWGFRVIPGVTTFESFGCNDSSEDIWSTNGSEGSTQDWAFARITSLSQSGKVGAWYRNVGTYQGKIVDLKISFVSYDKIRTTNLSFDGKKNYPCIKFKKSDPNVGFMTRSFEGLTMRYEFFDHDSHQKMAIKAHETLYDVDSDEYTDITHPSFSRAFLSENTKLQVSNSHIQSTVSTNASASDRAHWITVYIDGESFDIQYGIQNDNLLDTRQIRTWNAFGFDNTYSVAPFDTPDVLKTADKSVAFTTDTISYSMYTSVPVQPSGKEYTSYVIEDTLIDAFTLTNDALKVVDDHGTDVSRYFTLSSQGQKVTITGNSNFIKGSSFGGKSYTFTFFVKFKNDYDFRNYISNNKVVVSNKALVTTNYGTKTTTTVTTEIRFKIVSSIVHGTITASQSNIPGGSTKVYSYKADAGYEISSVKVDGVTVPINNKSADSYTFHNISKDHTIAVVCTPKKDCSLVITKRIDTDEIWYPHGNPTFIFKIEGKDIEGNNHVYYRFVEFDKDYVDHHTKTMSGNALVERSVTIDHLMSGTYQVSEIRNARYVFDSITDMIHASMSNEKAIYDLISYESGSATFVNKRKNYKDYSHNDVIINKLDK